MADILWTQPMLKRLKVAYKAAVKKGEQYFTFDNNQYFVGYVKYLIEYLEGEFNRKTK